MYSPACELLRGVNTRVSCVVVNPISSDSTVKSPPVSTVCGKPVGSTYTQVTTGTPVISSSSVTVQVSVRVSPAMEDPEVVMTVMRAVVRIINSHVYNLNY